MVDDELKTRILDQQKEYYVKHGTELLGSDVFIFAAMVFSDGFKHRRDTDGIDMLREWSDIDALAEFTVDDRGHPSHRHLSDHNQAYYCGVPVIHQ